MQFTIRESLYESISKRGSEAAADFVTSQMICNGFDTDKPHSVSHDEDRHVYIITQEGDDDGPEQRDPGDQIPGQDIFDVSGREEE